MASRFLSILVALMAFVAVTAVLLLVAGFAPAVALAALWRGSLGSWYALTSGTLVRATPLMLTGCAVAIAFRAGALNIGAEGQLLLGATGAIATALLLPGGGLAATVLGLAVGAGAGAAWAGIAAFLRARFGVLEVISTILLNFVALDFVSYLVRGPLQEPTHAYPQTLPISDAMHLPRVPGAGRLHAGLLIAVLLLVLAGWVMRKTAAGFRILAIGENPAAAASAGLIDTSKVITRVLLCSGALAGIAGAIEVYGVTYALYEDISPGYGYTAIAVALLAGLDPWWSILSAFGFAALEAGSSAMQRDAGVPSTLASIVEAMVILAVISIQAWKFAQPVRRLRARAAS